MTAELASLTLFRATPAQVHESRRRTWPQWGGSSTEDQYLERAALMDAKEQAVDSRMITWVLAPRDDPRTLNFMCACETYKRRGLVRYSGSTEVQEVVCYGVASVFTPSHKRGKGYASHMMRLLHWVTSGKTPEYNLPQFPVEWGAPPPEVPEAGDGVFSILYSDLGKEFYKSAGPGTENSGGWEIRSPFSTVWNIPQEAEIQQGGTDDEWTWLKHEELDTFWARDTQFIRQSMENVAESSQEHHSGKPKASVSCLPIRGVGSYTVFRSILSNGSMDSWGVVKKATNMNHTTNPPIFATWSVDTYPLPATLIVTRISATESEFPELLRCIQAAARKSGIGKMEMWNTPEHLLEVAADTGGRTFERRRALSGIKWYGAGRTEDIEWVLNEK